MFVYKCLSGKNFLWKKWLIFLKISSLFHKKIFQQKLLPNEHIFSSRNLEVKGEKRENLQNNTPTVNRVDD